MQEDLKDNLGAQKNKNQASGSYFNYIGGKWWIRTTEDEVDGFTVRCIWPLCKLPIILAKYYYLAFWSWWSESNQQPADYKSAALPLSHTSIFNLKKWCLRAESNRRHRDFQSLALPTELPRHVALCYKNGDLDGDRTHDL